MSSGVQYCPTVKLGGGVADEADEWPSLLPASGHPSPYRCLAPLPDSLPHSACTYILCFRLLAPVTVTKCAVGFLLIQHIVLQVYNKP